MKYYYPIIPIFLFAACTDDIEIEPSAQSLVHAVVSADSRTMNGLDAPTVIWAEDDAIGLFGIDTKTSGLLQSQSNLRYVTKDGSSSFVPDSDIDALYMPGDGSSIDIVGYYPYSTNLSIADNSHPLFSVDNWEDQSQGFSELDLCVSDIVSGCNTNNPQVNLQLKHVFCKIAFELVPNPEKGVSEEDLVGITATISNLNYAASCDLLSKDLSVKTTSFVSDKIDLSVADDGTLAQCLCVPVNTGTKRPVLTINVPKYNATMTYTLPSGKNFISGNCYKWRLKVGRKNVYMDATYEIVDWETLEPLDDVAGFDYNDPDGGAVDLGLPSGTWWATCNLGANSPEEPGDLYAWGEVEPKSIFTESNYKWYTSSGYSKYCTSYITGYPDMKKQLEFTDDAAWMKTSKRFRIPTREEFDELWNTCQRVRFKNGNQFIGPNGKSIIIPDEIWLATTWYENGGGYANAVKSWGIYETPRFQGKNIRPILNK